MVQDYTQYTNEDQKIWSLLFDRQIRHMKYACEEYQQGVENIGFERHRIPRFDKMNECLSDITGWEVEVVPGWIPENTFFELLYNRKFPSSTWLRKENQLDYLEEPDMFHDVFGHVPLLAHQPFVDFLFEISKIGLKYIDDPKALELLARVYWYTVEFGLISNENGLKIYGAGILSSPGETIYSIGNQPIRHEFNIKDIVRTPFRKDVYQDQYFVIESFEQLYDSVVEIENEITKQLGALNLYA